MPKVYNNFKRGDFAAMLKLFYNNYLSSNNIRYILNKE